MSVSSASTELTNLIRQNTKSIMSASQGEHQRRSDCAKNLRRESEWTWCPEFAHGWFDAVYYWGTGCPRCHPTEPPKKGKKKAQGTVALNWQWCPAEGHGWYEGITRDGFFRSCAKCVAQSGPTGSGESQAS